MNAPAIAQFGTAFGRDAIGGKVARHDQLPIAMAEGHIEPIVEKRIRLSRFARLWSAERERQVVPLLALASHDDGLVGKRQLHSLPLFALDYRRAGVSDQAQPLIHHRVVLARLVGPPIAFGRGHQQPQLRHHRGVIAVQPQAHERIGRRVWARSAHRDGEHPWR